MDTTSEFLKQGILGAVIVLLIGTVSVLYRENRGLAKDNQDLADKRVGDLIQMKDAYFSYMTAMKEAYFANQQSLKDLIENVLTMTQSLKEKFK